MTFDFAECVVAVIAGVFVLVVALACVLEG